MAVETKLNYCPNCNSKINAASVPGSNEPIQPEKNDITICCYCTDILEYTEDLSLIALRGETLDKFNQEELDELLGIRKKIVAFNQTKDGFPQQKAKNNA